MPAAADSCAGPARSAPASPSGCPRGPTPGPTPPDSTAEYVNHLTPGRPAGDRPRARVPGQHAEPRRLVRRLPAVPRQRRRHQPGRRWRSWPAATTRAAGAYGEQRAPGPAVRPGQGADQSPPGFLYNPAGTRPHGPMYSHGFATLFLAEAYGMVADRALQDRLQGARSSGPSSSSSNARTRRAAGATTRSKQHADSSVTICQIMALRAARNAGFFVPKEAADRCVKYVRSCQTAGRRVQLLQRPGRRRRSPARRPAWSPCYCAGVYSGPEIERGLRYLMQHKPGTLVGRGGCPAGQPLLLRPLLRRPGDVDGRAEVLDRVVPGDPRRAVAPEPRPRRRRLDRPDGLQPLRHGDGLHHPADPEQLPADPAEVTPRR